jgi:hypothetical protein
MMHFTPLLTFYRLFKSQVACVMVKVAQIISRMGYSLRKTTEVIAFLPLHFFLPLHLFKRNSKSLGIILPKFRVIEDSKKIENFLWGNPKDSPNLDSPFSNKSTLALFSSFHPTPPRHRLAALGHDRVLASGGRHNLAPGLVVARALEPRCVWTMSLALAMWTEESDTLAIAVSCK